MFKEIPVVKETPPDPYMTMSQCTQTKKGIMEELERIRLDFQETLKFHYKELREELIILEEERMEKERERRELRNQNIVKWAQRISLFTSGSIASTIVSFVLIFIS